MDILCLNCGEPWDLYRVYDARPGHFERSGCAIERCPGCCADKPEKFSKEERERLAALYEIAGILGGDDPELVAAFIHTLLVFEFE